MIDTIIQGDCLDVMKDIDDKSIDMILCDLPYGMTACSWDIRIPFEPLWEAYKRIIKDNGAIVLTASQPFTSELVCSNLKWFRHEWIWVKQGSNFCSLKHNPMREHESVLVFGKNAVKFNPIGQRCSAESQIRERYPSETPRAKKRVANTQWMVNLIPNTNRIYDSERLRHPASVQIFSRGNGYASVNKESEMKHPTQKPVALFEYLIKTYTNEGDLVLDNCIGSGTTAVACVNLNRHYIGIELSEEYAEIARKRVAEAIYARDSQPELALAGG